METFNKITNINDKKEYLTEDAKLEKFLNYALSDDLDISDFEEKFFDIREKYNESSLVGGKKNNSGLADVGSDTGKALFERKTNAIDAVLEYHYEKDNDSEKNKINSPKEAVKKWFDIDIEQGLKSLNKGTRQKLAKDTSILKYLPGNGPDKRIIDIIDNGIGISQKEFENTILSYNEDNKLGKFHCMGQFGQGGSASLKFAPYTLIVSKKEGSENISFTVIWYNHPKENERVKRGSYLFLSKNKLPLCISDKNINLPFQKGTIIRHIGYQLTKYNSSFGQNSIYMLAQKTLFNPPLPFYFVNKVNNYNRTIKGTRAALLGALDPEDKDSKLTIKYTETTSDKKILGGELGSVKIEYWLVDKKKSYYDVKKKKRIKPSQPLHHHINKDYPIIFTNNGQNQYEMGKAIIKNEMGLEYLKDNLVIHIDCDNLTLSTKRIFFPSTRETAARGTREYDAIVDSIIEHVRSDEELEALNAKAAEEIAGEEDTISKDELQKEVAKYVEATGGQIPGNIGPTPDGEEDIEVVKRPRRRGGGGRKISEQIKINEPPTYVEILWDTENIKFYPSRERYLRVITDANESYDENIRIDHDDNFDLVSKTNLKNGRFRFCLRCKDQSKIGKTGKIVVKIEDKINNLNLLDQKSYSIIDVPKDTNKGGPRIPDIKIIPVDGLNDENDNWDKLFEDIDDADYNDENAPAFYFKKIDTENTKRINVFYNTKYKPFLNNLSHLQKSHPSKIPAFINQYKKFLMCISYLQLDLEDKKKSLEKQNDTTNEIDKQLNAIKSQYRKSSAASAMMVAKNVVLNKEKD